MILGWVSLAIWLYIALFRRAGLQAGPPAAKNGFPARRVVAVIPARNEADVIANAIASLSGAYRVIVVDDDSNDGTAAAAQAATVIRGAPLPRGWTGKLWAVSQGIREATRFEPDYLLLCDADIVHPPGAIDDLVARAESGRYDLVSYMATLHCESLAERALIPAFVFFFFLLYPPGSIRNPRSRTAGAAGGCMLVRTAALEAAGGIESIRGALIDDCALAALLKRRGGRVWLGLNKDTRSIRGYGGWQGIGAMISRSAFTQLRHSPILLFGTVIGMIVTYLVPPVLALQGSLPAAAAWLVMSLSYLPMVLFYGLSPLWAATLPLTAAFYSGATIHSAVAYWRGRGGLWKGRVQDRQLY